MDSIQLKTKELLTYYCGCQGNLVTKTKESLIYYCGCYGNLVTIATRYVADAYCPKETPYQIWTQYDLRQRS